MNHSHTRLTVTVFSIFAVLIIVSSVSGCANMQSPFQQPVVKLANVQLLEVGLLQQVYGVTLQVDNPNGYSLPVKGVTYAVKLAGQDFAAGLTPNAFSIPANGSDQVQVEVRTNLMESIGHLSRLFREGPQDVDYQLSGDIQIDLPFIGAIPFSRSGTIPLTRRDNVDL